MTATRTSWIYFLHPPRPDFAATMTEEEATVFSEHFAHLERLLAEGVLVLAGPTLGETNTGITVFEAPDEAAARAVMESDPAIAKGVVRGELREMRVSLLRGRD
ncbi:MAG TPA: YciI family protein [Nocardioides sp.]|nr:YciI family protein [Nocardioides sp.]